MSILKAGRALAGLLISTGILLGAPSMAWADDDDDARMEKAQDAVLKGRKMLREGQYLDGIIAYEHAYRLVPQPEHLFVIARAYERIPGRCVDALLGWDRFMRACTECTKRPEGIKFQTVTKNRCAALNTRLEDGAPASVQERFDGGRKLYQQGKFADATAEFQGALDMFPSSAKITLHLARSRERERAFGAAATLYTEYLKKSPEGVDREAIERLTASLKRRAATEEPAAGMSVTSSAAPAGKKNNKVLAWSAVGLGAAATGLGAFFYSQANSTADDANGTSSRSRFDALSSDFDGQVTGLTVSFLLGAALVTTGITLFVMDGDKSTKVSLSPGQLHAVWAF